jgi:hypothetical protein
MKNLIIKDINLINLKFFEFLIKSFINKKYYYF